ncbi:MAG: type II toxin-antitoxin system HicA family toxin [Firmicutes bacterium]|nr:type II toxin-antitoxin system HicA family toxin [Bacillota bacterium]MBQ3931502.1 type II toxin-antitoxin system HicA family toxin [Bacillota bacterium]
MTGKELKKLLLNNGWYEERVQGSHHVMKKGARTEVIPIHGSKDLPAGLVNAILKRTGLKQQQ